MTFYVPSAVGTWAWSFAELLIWKRGGASDPCWRVQVLGVGDGGSGDEGDQGKCSHPEAETLLLLDVQWIPQICSLF